MTAGTVNGVLTPACTDPAIRSAIASATSAGSGIVDTGGCLGTYTMTAPVTIGANVVWKTAPGATYHWGSNQVTMGRAAKIQGSNINNTVMDWTSDTSGIVNLTGTAGDLVELENLTVENGVLATAANAVILLSDCARCILKNVLVAVFSSAASAGIRAKAVTTEGFGPWQIQLQNVTVQVTPFNGGDRSTSGQIGIDLVGSSSVMDGDQSLMDARNVWVEAQTVGISVFGGNSNHFVGGRLLNNGTGFQVAGSGAINSNSNTFDLDLQSNVTNCAFDGNSNWNRAAGSLSGTTTLCSDTAGNNIQNWSLGTGTAQLIEGPGSASQPVYTSAKDKTTGFWFNTAGAGAFSSAGTASVEFPQSGGVLGVRVGNTGNYNWSPNADPTQASPDTGLSRDSAGVVDVGNSAQGDKSGTLKAATLTAGTAVNAATYQTAGNCSAVGTAANPSVASCSAAPSGAFSCATNASGGTCRVNTTAVTANSNIIVQQVSYTGSRLSVTCNTNSVLPAGPLVTTISAGSSFTIALGTVNTNPGCFVYWLVN
jgi:hypothetical protein